MDPGHFGPCCETSEVASAAGEAAVMTWLGHGRGRPLRVGRSGFGLGARGLGSPVVTVRVRVRV
eukprot:scaffold3071_cov59-Phaeocystis_antarctica.AAC.5